MIMTPAVIHCGTARDNENEIVKILPRLQNKSLKLIENNDCYTIIYY